MIRSKIWIAFALVSFTAVFAQQPAKTRLTVQVTDVTGAAVPKALVEVGTATNRPSMTAEADREGRAEFNLPVGNYQLLVKSQGFCPHKKALEVLNQSSQIVEAKLQIDSCPGSCAGPCLTVYPNPGPTPGILVTEPRFGHLTIKVKDQAQGVIPGTQIGTITPPSTVVRVWATTDSFGEVAIDLDPGHYALSGTAPGFQRWIRPVDIVAGSNQSIDIIAVLSVNPCGVCVQPDMQNIPTEPDDLPVFIPLLPTHNLVLSAASTRKRH